MKIKFLQNSLVEIRVLMVVLIFAFTYLNAGAINYYVSTSGNDANNGTSTTTPWQTIAKVNAFAFNAGDQVLFNGGQTFSGNIIVSRSGTSSSRITFGSYGTGRATVNARNGSGFNLTGSFIKLTNINVVGNGITSGNTGYGAYVKGSNASLDHMDISGFQHTGVHYDNAINLNITYVNVHHNGNGINGYLGSNLYIGYCNADYNLADPTVTTNWSGSGIVVAGVTTALVEYCEASYNGKDQIWTGNGPCGIWSWDSDKVTIQYCISHHNTTNPVANDGTGFDIDGGTTNSVIQYCLSYSNFAYGYLVCEFDSNPWTNNTIRYCMSINDGKGGLASSLGGSGTEGTFYCHNNTFITNNSNPGVEWAYGTQAKSKFYNNIFLTSGPASKGAVAKGASFINNAYYKIGGGFAVDGYTDFNTWVSATNQEKLNNIIVGLNADPKLVNGTVTPTLTDPTQLATLTNYQLQSSSPCANKGLDLNSQFGINIGASDFYGNYPFQGTTQDIGAHETYTAAATPAAPVATEATLIIGTGFTANWKASSGSATYYFDLSTVSTFTSFVTGYDNLNLGNVNTIALSGLTATTTYYYRLRANNSAGTSDNSNVISAKAIVNIPSAVIATSATSNTPKSLSANWAAVETASSYLLDVSLDNNFASFVNGYNAKNVGNVTTSSVTGLTENTTYYYRVRATNSDGTGPNSNVITAATAATKEFLADNLGFEKGVLSPWATWTTTGTAGISTTIKRSGTYSGYARGGTAYLYQVISDLSPGTSYIVSFYVQNSTTSGSSVLVGVKNFGPTEVSQSVANTSGLWSLVTLKFSTGASNTSAEIYLWNDDANTIGYIDDVTITAELLSTSYSEIKTTGPELNVYPNPTSSFAVLEYSLKNDANVNVNLFNMNGQLVYSQKNSSTSGNNRFIINVEDATFTSGLYILKVNSNEINKSVRLNVVK